MAAVNLPDSLDGSKGSCSIGTEPQSPMREIESGLQRQSEYIGRVDVVPIG
jgi:hypothetical protein